MVHIVYPRSDKNNHTDLQNWLDKANYIEGDWTELKGYLAENARYDENIHAISKCWYTELPQGDNYALDIEHFRPKRSAKPLNQDKKEAIESEIGFKIFQRTDTGAYPWLEFDYRNYRLTSALPNRAGAKHDYFPLAKNSYRYINPELPWSENEKKEYCLLLDPIDAQDAGLLLVLNNGRIVPLTPKTALSEAEYNRLEENWRSDGFNYVRAHITIILYRLNEKVLISGRREVYNQVLSDIRMLFLALEKDIFEFIEEYSNKIRNAMLPSAPFALAARSALKSYIPLSSDNADLVGIQIDILNRILTDVESFGKDLQSWERLN
jgi:hypothetical protein